MSQLPMVPLLILLFSGFSFAQIERDELGLQIVHRCRVEPRDQSEPTSSIEFLYDDNDLIGWKGVRIKGLHGNQFQGVDFEIGQKNVIELAIHQKGLLSVLKIELDEDGNCTRL